MSFKPRKILKFIKNDRNEFAAKKIIETIEDNQISDFVTILYEQSIRFGAHPKHSSLGDYCEEIQFSDSETIYYHHLNAVGETADATRKFLIYVAVATLKIFEMVEPQIFKNTGNCEELEKYYYAMKSDLVKNKVSQ